jgi:transcriptional regulator with XRE-family HTH domain
MAKKATPSSRKESRERISPGEEYNLPIFRKRLAQVLEMRGVNQRQLARQLERDPRQVNLTVIGYYKPDLKMLKGIAEFLDVSLDWLFDIGRRANPQYERRTDTTFFALNGDASQTVRFPAPLVHKIVGSDLDNVHLISVDGQDMAPTFLEGDLVFVKKTGFQERSGIYLLRTGKVNVIRRLTFDAVSNKVTISRDSDPEDKHQTTPNKMDVLGQVFRLAYR